jgi:hypothetical protein
VTPIQGSLGATDLSGWVWATRDQVAEMLSEFAPDILRTPTLAGAEYVLSGLNLFSSFRPTFEYYTTFGGYNYIAGWTATQSGGTAYVPDVSAQYPVFYGSFSVAGLAALDYANPYLGVWLYRSTPFHNIGQALLGTNGQAVLKGSGALTPGAATALSVQNARPGSMALIAVGSTASNRPFLGGVFVPSRDLLLQRMPLDAGGHLALIGAWPASIPSGISLYAQCWFVDPGTPGGAAASNALRIDVP